MVENLLKKNETKCTASNGELDKSWRNQKRKPPLASYRPSVK